MKKRSVKRDWIFEALLELGRELPNVPLPISVVDKRAEILKAQARVKTK
jgi:hypothetical protein